MSKEEAGKMEDAVFFHATQDIMNRVGQKMGTVAMGDHHFQHSFFSAWFNIIQMVWDMLGRAACALRSTNQSICFGLSIC